MKIKSKSNSKTQHNFRTHVDLHDPNAQQQIAKGLRKNLNTLLAVYRSDGPAQLEALLMRVDRWTFGLLLECIEDSDLTIAQQGEILDVLERVLYRREREHEEPRANDTGTLVLSRL